ncbi:XPG domain-containing domain-containing protein [Trichoderma chlorosporum]
MGIPHLISTLENYASHEVLQSQAVVIDGPALAYHILHLCRFQGANQPSYGLLSRLVIEWLDRLEDQQVSIRAIYFDGYLPESKQHVRMERVMKLTSRLNSFYSSHSMACPRKYVAPVDDIYLDASNPGKFPDKTLLDPGFLVPAIIDAVRGSPRYREKCFIVPGEADAYCASDVAKHGGTILTSDSDLLAHELGNGKVAFFRDIHENASSMLACTMYAPRAIYTKLGLSNSVEACRLGYERLRSPNATLPMLLKACSRPIADGLDYDHFRQQYVRHEKAPVPHLMGGGSLSLSALDPRVSELLLQIGQAPKAKNAREKAKIFLPSLIENPTKGTSWDASVHVRRLAYTVACRYLECRCSMSVEEYRRVQNIDQKGREISVLSSDEANRAVSEFLELLKRARETNVAQQHHWVLLCVILDAIECNLQGKNSHALITLQRSGGNLAAAGSKISWDVIHFSAHIHAGLYSLRILSQVLSSVIVETNSEDEFTLNLIQIRGILSKLPPLHEFPDICVLSEFLKASKELQVLQILSGFVIFERGTAQEPENPRPKAEERKSSKRGGKSQGISKKTTKKSNNISTDRGNIFNVLSIDT